MTEAAATSTEIATNIAHVAAAAATTTEGVQANQQAADELSRLSTELRALVSRFRY